jgi:hypothetical protein
VRARAESRAGESLRSRLAAGEKILLAECRDETKAEPGKNTSVFFENSARVRSLVVLKHVEGVFQDLSFLSSTKCEEC